MLQSITEIAKTQENKLTKEEIKKYFKDMELEEQHYQHIYQYLGDNRIQVQGFRYQPITEKASVSKENNIELEENKQIETSVHLKMYLKELENLPQSCETESMFLRFYNQEENVKEEIISVYLPVVVELAKSYQDKGMALEDLIQEGNMGLLQALEKVNQIQKLSDADRFIKESIQMAMIQALDEETEENDWESAILAKTNLISEAAKYLAEDLGRVATIEELSEYTRMTETEIKDLLELSLDAVKVGSKNN